jgi:hypothetical protein
MNMSRADFDLEANEERGQQQALREEKFLEDWKEEQWQKKQVPKYLNCDDIGAFTKEVKCRHCNAILPHDLAFQIKHLENCRGL